MTVGISSCLITGFQPTQLAESRDGDFYIGSGRKGYFRFLKSFYETKLDATED